MAQFDVYKNSNKNTQGAYPYIVDIQSPLISELATRIVIPLGKKTILKMSNLTDLRLKLTIVGNCYLTDTADCICSFKNTKKTGWNIKPL